MITNNKTLVAIMLFTTLLLSCNNEDIDTMQDSNIKSFVTDSKQDNVVSFEQFFEVAKGDSIGKGIFRDKPIFNDDVLILATSTDETNIRGGVWSGVGGGTYISDLMTSVRGNDNAPSTMEHGGRTYYLLPIDLNEGAGGKYIYLYYTKWPKYSDPPLSIPLYTALLQVHVNCCFPILSPTEHWERSGTSFGSGGWTDLNEGAGGYYIYLESMTVPSANSVFYPHTFSPIVDVAIISSTKKESSYKDAYGRQYILIPTDLNMGAGGKYIYIAYTYNKIFN